ncbi:MAG: hypothetical protein BEN19_02560 [Epulopiscium sp. Nuni2H_MBin003]|nr:MAG: hypothetical protein BEN19_02560 [Epulopiscium sp. Nuni2H_MBin003]
MAILNNQVLLVSIVSWFLAQLFKLILTFINERKIDWSKLTASGGMPSSHSSFTVALAVGIGQIHGYDSTLFAMAFVFSCVVMYDAANVRMQAGNQAILLNKIMEHMKDHKFNIDFTLKEILGHTPTQVLFGAMLGIVVALIGVR